MKKRALLLILDGWGIGNKSKADVISSTSTPYWQYLLSRYPHSQLQASGENVGLPDGQMGNSEVGHLNIGAGRVLYQDLVKINKAAENGTFVSNPEIVKAYEFAKANNSAVHFMGLFSDGGVHSSMDHLKALCNISKHYGVDKTFIHAFMDGRDTDPRSGLGFVRDFESFLKGSTGELVSIIGRYYAMDRDKRWERVRLAYDLLLKGVGEQSTDLVSAVERSYANDVTDEFIKPIVKVNAKGEAIGRIQPNDVVIFFNYRNDRAKELTQVLTQEDLESAGMKTLPLYFCTMTPYDAKFTGLHILFDKENVVNTIGEHVASLGLSQLRIAETEKYAHVTFFFSGGREMPFENEERVLVSSPKVATYDLQPEMSVYEVADKLTNELNKQKFDFVVCNFANGDMVGHTGDYKAIIKAIRAVDGSMNKVVEAAKSNGYQVVIIADHGNADNAINADGTPNTAHSLNPVPFVYVNDDDLNRDVKDGILADVAPTICKMLDIAVPDEMTGDVLLA